MIRARDDATETAHSFFARMLLVFVGMHLPMGLHLRLLTIAAFLSGGCFPSSIHLCPIGGPADKSACDPATDNSCGEEYCVCVSNAGEATGTWRCNYPMDLGVPDLSSRAVVDLAQSGD